MTALLRPRVHTALFTLAFLTLVLSLGNCLRTNEAHADTIPHRYQGAQIDRNAALTLARMCAGESGPDDLDVCAAQVGVIARRAARRGLSLSRMAYLYSAALRQPQRLWVLELADTRRAPTAWPDGASWRRYQSRFARLLENVEAQLKDAAVADPCPGAEHFGSLHLDGHRMRAWDRMCPELSDRQAFWGRP